MQLTFLGLHCWMNRGAPLVVERNPRRTGGTSVSEHSREFREETTRDFAWKTAVGVVFWFAFVGDVLIARAFEEVG